MATMAELAEQVDRLTPDHLSIIVRTLAASPPAGTADHDFITYGLATEALRFFSETNGLTKTFSPFTKTRRLITVKDVCSCGLTRLSKTISSDICSA